MKKHVVVLASGVLCALLFVQFLFDTDDSPVFQLQAQDLLTNEAITRMSHAKLSDETIIAAIEQQPGKFVLNVDEIVGLQKAGVSEKVIQALLRHSGSANTIRQPQSIVVPDGTLVRLKTSKAISSETASVGDSVPAVVSEDVMVAGTLAIPKGTPVRAVVRVANPAKKFHGAGKLELEFQQILLLDGTKATLREEKERAAHKSMDTVKGTGKAIVATTVPIVGLGMIGRGKDTELPAGSVFSMYMNGTVTLKASEAAKNASNNPKSELTGSSPNVKAGAKLRPVFLPQKHQLQFIDRSGAIVVTHTLLKESAVLNKGKRAVTVKTVPLNIVNAAGTTLYVLQKSPGTSKISAYSLSTGEAIGNASFATRFRTMRLSSDDTRLVAYGLGAGRSKVKDQRNAMIAVLESSALEVKFIQRFPSAASNMEYVKSMDRVFVMDEKRSKVWFVDPSASEGSPIDLGGLARGAIISNDGRYLLTLVRNTNQKGTKVAKGGVLNQFDIPTGKLLHTSEAVDDARALIRIGNTEPYWVVLDGKLRRVSQEGDPMKAILSFHKSSDEYGKALGGLPGPAITFGDRIAIGVLKNNGTLAHKVALVDPESGSIEKIVDPIGRPGVRTGKATKRFLGALALSAAMGAAGGAASAATHTMVMTPVFMPGGSSQATDMAISSDKQYLYVLDVESEDITVIKADGTTAAVLPVKSNEQSRLWRPAKGPYLYHFAGAAVTVIDSTKFSVLQTIPIEKGYEAKISSARGEFYLCNKKSCDIWNAVTASGSPKVEQASLSQQLRHTDEADAADDEDDSMDEDDVAPPSAQKANGSATPATTERKPEPKDPPEL